MKFDNLPLNLTYPYHIRYDFDDDSLPRHLGEVQEIINWAKESLQHDCLIYSTFALFEDESDMMLFMLRW